MEVDIALPGFIAAHDKNARQSQSSEHSPPTGASSKHRSSIGSSSLKPQQTDQQPEGTNAVGNQQEFPINFVDSPRGTCLVNAIFLDEEDGRPHESRSQPDQQPGKTTTDRPRSDFARALNKSYEKEVSETHLGGTVGRRLTAGLVLTLTRLPSIWYESSHDEPGNRKNGR